MFQKDKITVYTPQSDIRHPLKLFKGIFRDAMDGRELAWRLLVRNISARYRQSFLGILWAFLPPLVSTLMWVFLQKASIFNMGETSIPYPVYVMVGTVLWEVFSKSINAPIQLVNNSRAMLTKINFPREAILMTAFGEVVFEFMIKLILLVGIFIWFGITPGWTILLFFVGVWLIILLGMTIGIFLTPLAMLSGDIQSMVSVVMGIWFFLTPVIYPKPEAGIAALLADVNPISPLLLMTRDWATIGLVDIPASFWIVIGVMFVVLMFGMVLYRVAMPHIIERVGS